MSCISLTRLNTCVSYGVCEQSLTPNLNKKNDAVKRIGEVKKPHGLQVCRRKGSRVGEETTWGGRLFQTGMVEGRNENLYGSLDVLNGTHMFVWWMVSANPVRHSPLQTILGQGSIWALAR